MEQKSGLVNKRKLLNALIHKSKSLAFSVDDENAWRDRVVSVADVINVINSAEEVDLTEETEKWKGLACQMAHAILTTNERKPQ